MKDEPKEGKKIGGQVGHKGNYRAKMEADEVIRVKLQDNLQGLWIFIMISIIEISFHYLYLAVKLSI